jgi:hypothetical protein
VAARRRAGRTLVVEAFGEATSALSVAAPLVRVPEGTAMAVSVRNDLPHALRRARPVRARRSRLRTDRRAGRRDAGGARQDRTSWHDFEFDAPAGRRTRWLELRTPGGRWHAQAHVIVR